MKRNHVCRDLPASSEKGGSFSRQRKVGNPAGWWLAQMSPDQSTGMIFHVPPLAAQLLISVGGYTPVTKWSKAPSFPLALLRESPALCDGINVSLRVRHQLINFTRSWMYFLLSECPFRNFKSKAERLVTGILLSELFWFIFEHLRNCTQPKKARAWAAEHGDWEFPFKEDAVGS